MAADGPTDIGAKGGECAGGGGGAVRGNCQSQGPFQIPQTLNHRVAIEMEDCDQCLVEDNLAALVSKRAQTDEGMGKRRHDMARHCCWGEPANGN
jgi:hypothetical protein